MKLHKQFFISILMVFGIAGANKGLYAQQNVGIGTSSPHPSAILHLADSLGKGLLIPSTDTNAVIAFVNSLTPNPGIANGLLIFQKSDQVFYYYDGDQNVWVPLSGITGPTGPKGLTGPTGPKGPDGGFSITRHGVGAPAFEPGDTYGDYYFDTWSGRMWEVNEISTSWRVVSGGANRASWRNQIQNGVSIHRVSTVQVLGDQPAVGSTVDYQLITGLSAVVNVGFDTTAYAMIKAYGTVRKETPNNDYNYARFDFRIKGAAADVKQDVGIGPNGPAPHNNYDLVSWQIAYFAELSPGSNTIEVIGGQREGRSGTGKVILAGPPGSETQAHLDIYVIFRRND